jgi:hypothetical protein
MAAPSADAENQLAQGERQPLLSPDQKHQAPSKEEPIEEWDSTDYDITKMTSWAVFGMVRGCAWDNKSLWKCTGCAVLLSFTVAAVIFFIPHANLISPEKVEKLGTFLNVFVGLLLGFFLSSSMNRWYGCVSAFLGLLDSIRGMQMQMTALGVCAERTKMLRRYGLLSAWLLHLSLTLELVDDIADVEEEDPDDAEKDRKKVWKRLEAKRPGLVTPNEKELLMQHTESYALVWTWVASLIGRMAQNGEIPPMPSPTYGRILNIVQMAYGSIRDVRALHLVKAPFIYVHTLAILVHVNNILNAIGFGLVLGLALLEFTGKGDLYNKNSWANICCSLFMQFCFSMVAPFLYLALLEVSVCVAQPFTYMDAKIPALKFLKGVEEDLKKAEDFGDDPPDWDKPCFKTK